MKFKKVNVFFKNQHGKTIKMFLELDEERIKKLKKSKLIKKKKGK